MPTSSHFATTSSKLSMAKPKWAMPPWAPIPPRPILGFGFVYHGFPKLFSAEGHEMFLGML